jgi:hypothetical protein
MVVQLKNSVKVADVMEISASLPVLETGIYLEKMLTGAIGPLP